MIAGSAQAATVSYAFEGVVTSLVRDGGLFGAPGSVQVGDTFTGRVTYETGPTNPDQEPGDPEIGAYALVELVVDQSVLPPFSPFGIGVAHAPPLVTLPPAPPDFGRDWFLASASSSIYPTVRFWLRGPYDSAFVDDSLPETLDLADFPDGAFLSGLVAVGIPPNPSIQDLGTITSLSRVPEPGTLALIAAGLLALGARRPRTPH